MAIPNVLERNGKSYIYKKQVNDDLFLYQNFKGGYMECFSRFDIGLNQRIQKEYYTKWEK